MASHFRPSPLSKGKARPSTVPLCSRPSRPFHVSEPHTSMQLTCTGKCSTVIHDLLRGTDPGCDSPSVNQVGFISLVPTGLEGHLSLWSTAPLSACSHRYSWWNPP